ncbi:MAG: YpzG family protein [Solibacillus sp.]|uniref:YpzG family protein n=1 Tax=unclassified Solibacillus TaxID=2637870 RepID=UPI0030FC929B
MGKKVNLDPKSQKIHQNWTRVKHQKSQVNGQTEITLHNQLLRSAAKAKQF